MSAMPGQPSFEGVLIIGGQRGAVEPGGPERRLFVSGCREMLRRMVHVVASDVDVEVASECSVVRAARSKRRARACCFSTVLIAMPR